MARPDDILALSRRESIPSKYIYFLLYLYYSAALVARLLPGRRRSPLFGDGMTAQDDLKATLSIYVLSQYPRCIRISSIFEDLRQIVGDGPPPRVAAIRCRYGLRVVARTKYMRAAESRPGIVSYVTLVYFRVRQIRAAPLLYRVAYKFVEIISRSANMCSRRHTYFSTVHLSPCVLK